MITKDMKSKNQKMINGETEELEQRDHPTIFHELLQSDLPPQEKEVQRLGDEAQTILGARLEATAWALTVAAFHILNNTNILKRLHHELKEAIPGPHDELDWQRLEKLPYLTACIQEVLRFSYGVTVRHPRVSNQATIQYKEVVHSAGNTGVNVHHRHPPSREDLPRLSQIHSRAVAGEPADS